MNKYPQQTNKVQKSSSDVSKVEEKHITNYFGDTDDTKGESINPELWKEKINEKHITSKKREIIRKIKRVIYKAAKIDGDEDAQEGFRKNPKKIYNILERKTWESKNKPSKRPRDNMTMEDEVQNWGFNSVRDFKQTIETNPDWYDIIIDEIEINNNFTVLYKYLGKIEKKSDKTKIEKFNSETAVLEKLELLRTMSLSDAIKCIHDQAGREGTYAYRDLANRLNFYQKLSHGTATRTYSQKEWDDKKGKIVDVTREKKINSSDVTSETIRLGILRDIMYSAMIGTPELAILKITKKRINEDNKSQAHMPEIKGYHSGIHAGSIGDTYPFLHDLYKKARKRVEGRKSLQEADKKRIEHKAVLVASDWLEEAMKYNLYDRGPESPYVSSIEESIAWARLGDDRVKAQFKGMRQKLMNVNLQNIYRFIGKCGTNKYDKERRKLYGQIKFLKESYDNKKKQEFLTRENEFAIKKQERWIQGEKGRLAHKREKNIAEIEKLDLPEEEKRLQLESIEKKYSKTLQIAEESYQTAVNRFKTRTIEEFLSDMEEKQQLVETRYEKRKNLAQKALDLHWMKGTNPDEDNTYSPVDWINYAPLGTIKRSHRMMREGILPEKIIKYALSEIICGKRGLNREDLAKISKLYDSANAGSWEERENLESMMKVGNILSFCEQEVSLDDVQQMSKQRFYGMTPALREYSLEEVREFMNKKLDLKSIVKVKKNIERFGYNLNNDEIAEMASHNIDELEDALRSFDLDAVRTLLQQDVNLVTAVSILNNTQQFDYELSISQIAIISKNVNDIEDFTSALNNLPLDQVELLLTAEVPYHEYSKVRSVLKKNKYNSEFSSTLAISQKLARNNQYDNFNQAMNLFSLAEIESILDQGTTLSGVIEVSEVFEENSIYTTLEETIQFSKNAGNCDKKWIVEKAIYNFGIENVRAMVTQGVILENANDVKSEIKRKKLYHIDNIKIITTIAKHRRSVEVALKTLEAGFSVEEITRFPFLISPLVSKMV